MTIKQQGGIFGRNPTFNNVEASDVDADSISTRNLIVGEIDSSVITPLRVLKKFNGTTAIEYAGGETSDPYADIYMAGNESLSIRLDPTNSYPDSSFFINHNGSNRVELEGSTSDFKILSGNLVISTSGKGIDFSATSGTGTSELFDDYEEGTWTPVLTFGGASVGITYSHQTGLYTKIGNVVKFELRIRISSKGTSTGNAVITGLPFSPSSSLNGYVGRQFLCYTSAITASTPVGIVFDTSTSISLYETPGSSLAALNDTDFTTNSYLTITGSYTAA